METKNRLLTALVSIPPERNPHKREAAVQARIAAMMRALVSRSPINPNPCRPPKP